jgi:hypothetical protein
LSPAIIFTTNGEIMALKSKQNKEALPEDFQVTEKPAQISFDDLEFEGSVEEERTTQYHTISGKESWYEPTWENYTIKDLNVKDEFEGRPEITYFENKDRKSDSLRLKVMDDGEIVTLYINIPKPDKDGVVTNIAKGDESFSFYRTAYDFIFSILRWKDETNVVNPDGEEITVWDRVNIINFAKFVDQFERIGVRITEGEPTSDFNSFIIYKME